VLDLSMFRKHQRIEFATVFAERLFHRKKGAASALHVFIEEAQTFLPQFDRGGESARMIGAFEDLTKIGRNFGIGHTLISQRPQAVNKDALNQVGTLFVFRTIAKQERRAIQDWIVEHDVEARIDELPKMATGEAFVWSPAWLRRFEKVRILPKKTYDASATPTVGSSRRTVRLAGVDLARLQEAMKASVERAAAEDPKKLRARIAALERELAAKPAAAPAPARAKTVRVEIPVVSEKKIGQLARAVERLFVPISIASKQLELTQQTIAVWKALQQHRLEIAAAAAPGEKPSVSGSGFTHLSAASTTGTAVAVGATVLSVHPRTPASTNGQGRQGGRLTKGERLMLAALAMHAPDRVPAPRAALTSGYSINSSTFRNILSQLRTAGYAEGERSRLGITEKGLEALGSFEPLPTGPELQRYWLDWVGPASAPGRVLSAVLGAWPDSLERDALAERAGQSPLSSTFRNALSTLRTLGLVSGRGAIAASPHLFETAHDHANTRRQG
jgi:hypothetical protein